MKDLPFNNRIPNPEFEAWVATLSPDHWARYDLTAARLGWEARQTEIDMLRHWMHNYRTPELSMVAMLEKIEKLKAEIDDWKNDVDLLDLDKD